MLCLIISKMINLSKSLLKTSCIQERESKCRGEVGSLLPAFSSEITKGCSFLKLFHVTWVYGTIMFESQQTREPKILGTQTYSKISLPKYWHDLFHLFLHIHTHTFISISAAPAYNILLLLYCCSVLKNRASLLPLRYFTNLTMASAKASSLNGTKHWKLK